MGKVVQLNSSNDRQIRSANVKLANNQIITRPLFHLYPFEVSPGPQITDKNVKFETDRRQSIIIYHEVVSGNTARNIFNCKLI